MHFSTRRIQQAYGVTGSVYDVGSVYEGLSQLTDIRKARGKLYGLETVLMIIVMAKLCGNDKPVEMADWGKHHQDELVKLLQLERSKMPHHNTYRRIMAYAVYQEEIERIVGAYNQGGEHGQVYALDGKAVRGMRKENEITKAPKALQLAEISQKVVTGDALHTQRGLAAQIIERQADYLFPVKENQSGFYKNIQALFAPEYPQPGFGKIQTDFLTAQKANDHNQ